MKVVYEKILVMKWLELEQVLGLHVADVVVLVKSRNTFHIDYPSKRTTQNTYRRYLSQKAHPLRWNE